jgi:hypothetical protein
MILFYYSWNNSKRKYFVNIHELFFQESVKKKQHINLFNIREICIFFLDHGPFFSQDMNLLYLQSEFF